MRSCGLYELLTLLIVDLSFLAVEIDHTCVFKFKNRPIVAFPNIAPAACENLLCVVMESSCICLSNIDDVAAWTLAAFTNIYATRLRPSIKLEQCASRHKYRTCTPSRVDITVPHSFNRRLHNSELTASLNSLGPLAWVKLSEEQVCFTIIPEQGTQVWA